MSPSDVIDLNRPMATGRFMPGALVQEKAGLTQGLPGNRVCTRVPGTSSMRGPSRPPLFPIAGEEERIANNRHTEHLSFLLGEIAGLKAPRPGLFSSLKRIIARPAVTTTAQPPSSAALSYTHQSVPPTPVPLEASPLFKTPAHIATSAPPRDEEPQTNAPELRGILAYQGLHLQLRMALSSTCIAKRGSPTTTEASPQLFPARFTPSNHTFNSSTSLVTPAMKNLFVGPVSEVATEADLNSIPLTPVLSPLQRAIAEARSAGYHLHKPVPLTPPSSSPAPPHSCEVETQRVLHGDGLRRLVLCKNASVYPIPGKEANKSSSNANVHDVDYQLCLRRVGKGVGDDWVHRFRIMPSTVNLDVRLWDSKRSEDNKIEVQLGKALLRSSPLRRVLKNSIRRDSVELEYSHHIPRRLRNVRSKIHRRRVVVETSAKGASESTPSLAPVTRERRRDRLRNSVRAKRRDMSEGTSEAVDKVRRWSDEWKRIARLMAMPKPGIETTRSEQAPEAYAASAISTPMGRRSGWAKLKEHLTSHHGYLEEDTSDEELMEDDDEADITDDLCHSGCKPVFVSLPSPVSTSPSSKVLNNAAVKAEEESQAKVRASMDAVKHSQTPLSHVHSLKTLDRQAKRT